MTTSRAIAAALLAVSLTACDKNAVQPLTGPVAGSYIKFFNFGVGAPNVNFYANDTKITAIQSTTGTESTLGVAYGGAVYAGSYMGWIPKVGLMPPPHRDRPDRPVVTFLGHLLFGSVLGAIV